MSGAAKKVGGFSKKLWSNTAGGMIAGKLMGKGVEAGQGGVQLDSSPFDITAEAGTALTASQGQLTNALAEQKAINAARTGSIAQMGQIAQGKGPSLATAQLKAAQDRSLAQLVAQQAANRGQGGGSAARNLAVASTMGNRNVAQDSAQARLQEVTQARQQLFQEKQAADEAASGGIASNYGYALAPKTSMQDFEKTKAGVATQNAAIAAQERSAKRAANAQMIGSIIGGAGALAASDEKLKKDVKPESKKMEKFLSAINAKSFEYKNTDIPGTSPGDKFGVLAQDLEKSEVGKTLVQDSPNGKMVDINSTVMAVLAAQSDLNKRLKSMEKKKK